MVSEHQDTVRVMLVDDDARIRASVPPMVASWAGHTVVDVLPSADSLISAVVKHQPDVVLLDLDMPGRSALEAISDLGYRGSDAKILVLSALDDAPLVRASLGAGARGYILKDDGPSAIHVGISTVMDGRRYLSPGLIERGMGGMIGDEIPGR